MDVQIPDKLYFKIGEVAELAGVKPHVLRYWETEFGTFRPGKSRTQQRKYTRKDVELVLRLKDLLHNQGYTIAGARKKLREDARRSAVAAAPETKKPVVAKRKRAAKAAPSDPAADALPEPVATSAEEVDPNQMMLPLVSGLDGRLLDEIRRDLQALRDSLSRAPSGE